MALPLTDYSGNKQHAVPQNIMSVEFKLIGNMTVRQFVYAAIGVIGAYLTYASALPGIFKWPLAVVIGLGGISFAFLPVQDRGMDIWIRNFLAAISRPTLRIWKKEPLAPAFLLSDYATALKNEVSVIAPAASRAKLMEYLGENKNLHPKNQLDLAEELFLEHLNFNTAVPSSVMAPVILRNPRALDPFVTDLRDSSPGSGVRGQNDEARPGRAIKLEATENKPALVLPEKPPALPVVKAEAPVTGKSINLTEQVVDLKNLVEKIRHKQGVIFELARPKPKVDVTLKTEEEIPPLLSAELKKLELETNVAEAAALKQKEDEKKKQEQIAKELEEMKASLAENRGQSTEERFQKTENGSQTPVVSPLSSAVRPQPSVIRPPVLGEKPREVTEEIKTEKNVSLSQAPNVINGVVKDQNGKMLQGVIIVVKDENGDPVRALKTNEIGQFVISTPLPNGKYLVTASQPPYRFATMELRADGRILPPLSFAAKENYETKPAA